MSTDKKKQFNFEPLPSIKSVLDSGNTIIETKFKLPVAEEITTKVTFFIKESLKEKANSYAYWEGLTQQDIIIRSLESFLADKEAKDRPLSVKNRKVGRKKIVR